MAEVEIYVLQTPKVILDGNPMLLPYKKAEALLYYMAVEKHATRDQIAALLWDNCDESTAKKNLRHALYTIRKVFNIELFISQDRQTLCLNPEVNFYTDIEKFLEERDIEVYREELLSSFYVKNAYPYEEWLTWKRNTLRDTYLRIIGEKMQQSEFLSVTEAEMLFERYIKEDPLDEQAYFYMMKIYEKQQLYYKGIRLYQQLTSLLNVELRVSPKKEIRDLHSKFVEVWRQEAEQSKEQLEGHEEQMRSLERIYKTFLAGIPQVVFLSGETGVGKTYLTEQFFKRVKKERVMVLKTFCLETEQQMDLQPWNAIMIQLSKAVKEQRIVMGEKYLQAAEYLFPFLGQDYDKEKILPDVSIPYSYRTIKNLLLQFLVYASEQIPLILSFDNIQYMDKLSLEFLSLLVRTRNKNIMILMSGPDILTDGMRRQVAPLLKEKYMERISVTPFSKEEVKKIAKNKLGERAENPEFLDWIYEESNGNAFFLEMLLEECVKGTFKEGENSHLNQLLKEQLEALSKGARQVLELCASCQAWADMDALEQILKRDSLDLLEEIEELKKKGLIYEKEADGQIRFYFCHGNMQKFVHAQMSPSKVRVFHSKLAEYIENLSSYESSKMGRLVYHYTICGNKRKALTYKILSLGEYSRKFYELYPIYSNSYDRDDFQNTLILEYCNTLEQELLELYQKGIEKEGLTELYIMLLQIKAQYCIPQGYYEKGIECAKKALMLNSAYENSGLTKIRCLRFLIYHQVNVWELSKTEEHLQESLLTAKEGQYEEEYAITCRLYGLYCSMTGDFAKSMEYLQKALTFFESQPLKFRTYALNISACYNYMGEDMRKQQMFEEAIKYYKKAAQVCEKSYCTCNPVVYSNLGRAYLAMGDRKESEQAFYKSEELYEESFTLVGRSLTQVYLSLLEAEKGEVLQAKKMLEDAEKNADQLASPYTLGILNCVKAELKEKYGEMFGNLLNSSAEEYRNQAVSYLEHIPGVYEVE